MRLAFAAVLLAAVPVPALADPASPSVNPTGGASAVAPAKDPDDKAAPLGSPEPAANHGHIDHVGQFGISLRAALGMRALAPYDKAVYCGSLDKSTSSGYAPVCVGRSPFVLDLEASYGLRAKLDAFLEIRLGIETDFGSSPTANDGPHIVHVSPGIRVFFSEARRSKLFSTAQLVLDFSGYKDSSGLTRGADFGVRNLNGLWFEIDKSYAAYVYVGETLTFVRWLSFELEGGVGFQVRY